MPVIKSAIKKLRKDKKRQAENDKFRLNLEKAIKKVKKETSQKTLKSAMSFIDKATKKNIFHKNKAARLKSQLAKLIRVTPVSKKITTPTKPVRKKTKNSKGR